MAWQGGKQGGGDGHPAVRIVEEEEGEEEEDKVHALLTMTVLKTIQCALNMVTASVHHTGEEVLTVGDREVVVEEDGEEGQHSQHVPQIVNVLQVLLCALSMASVSVLHTDLGGQSVGGKAAMVVVEETMVGEVEVMEVVVVEYTMVLVLEEDQTMVEGVMEEVEVTMPVQVLQSVSMQMLKQTVEAEDMEMVEEVTREVGDGLGMVEEVPMVLVVEVVPQIKIVPVMLPSAASTSSAGRLQSMGVMAREEEEVVGQQGVEEVVGVAAMAVEEEEEGHAMAAGGRKEEQ